jgi:hypothetical protein
VVLERYTEAYDIGAFKESVTIPVISVCPFNKEVNSRKKNKTKVVRRINIRLG